MNLIVGLGNPGKDYVNTRHNAGFLLLDFLNEKWKGKSFRLESKLKSKISIIKDNSKNVLLLKPQTYMNLSGEAVKKVMDYYKIISQNIIVIYDDLDLEIGMYKITQKPFKGGHKGVRSIIDYIDEDKFIRIRIGIEKQGGRKNRNNISGEKFVLSKFSSDEKKVLYVAFNKIFLELNKYFIN